ncbi:fimbrial protein [Pseudomonas putida]
MNTLTRAALLTLACSAGLAVQAQAADGEINFSGNITTSTCSISVGDTTGGTPGEVKLGSVPLGSLAAAGNVGGGGAFSLFIDDSDENCDLTGKKATVTFLGLSGVDGPAGQWLGVDKVAGYANNVAIQLKDAKGNEVRISEPSSEYLQLNEPLRFTANYIATGRATAGPANGKAAFTVNIQ